MTQQKRVLIVGSFCNLSGYSDHARLVADSLIAQNSGHKFYLLDLQWAESSRDMKYVKKYGSMINETAQYFNFLKQTGTPTHQVSICCYFIIAREGLSNGTILQVIIKWDNFDIGCYSIPTLVFSIL